jgi:hypothetical protein
MKMRRRTEEEEEEELDGDDANAGDLVTSLLLK